MLIDFRKREREEERERGNVNVREKEALVGCLLHMPQPRLIWNLGKCPDQELNPQPFSLWDDVLTS